MACENLDELRGGEVAVLQQKLSEARLGAGALEPQLLGEAILDLPGGSVASGDGDLAELVVMRLPALANRCLVGRQAAACSGKTLPSIPVCFHDRPDAEQYGRRAKSSAKIRWIRLLDWP